MNLAKIVESYKKSLDRFNIQPEIEELVFSILSGNGWRDYTANPSNFHNLLEQETKHLDGQSYHIYRATGTFKKGSIKLGNGRIVGRNADNLLRILEIPLDADCINYGLFKKGIDPRDHMNKDKIEEIEKKLHNLSDSKLNPFLDYHIELIKDTLNKAQMPYSEMVRSGYGHYVNIFISPKDQTRINEIRNLHKKLSCIFESNCWF